MADNTVRVRIEGKVQGVWYRAWTEKTATGLGLSGWVRNRPDGTVEALFSGDEAAVEAMLDACHDGPPLARVAAIQVDPADPPGMPGFTTRPDG